MVNSSTRLMGKGYRIVSVLLAVLVSIVCMSEMFTASAATSSAPAKPVMIGEKTMTSDYTHPFNKQTNTIVLHWNAVKNTGVYEVYVKKGQYENWTLYKKTSSTSCTVSGLRRAVTYQFRVRAYNGRYSSFSKTQSIKTARMDYDLAGWKAMCRIVYHEVGGMAGSMWDKPIVYVADCVANQFVAAKYTNIALWKNYYRNYKNVQDIIYKSGGFMSEAGLTRDGATYAKVTDRVKKAVWGAVYGKTYYNGIANDYNVFYWCNRSYYQSSSKIAYSFKIPWGYFNVWRQYWG